MHIRTSKRYISTLLIIIQAFLCYSQAPQWHWATSINTNDHEQINELAVDKSNNFVYTVGEWTGDLSAFFTTGANPSTDLSSTYGDEDGLVAKYDSSGNVLWAFKLGGPTRDEATAISLDQDGNIYVTGFFGTGTSYFSGTSPHTGASTLSNTSNDDFFLAKYNSDGEFIWVRRSEADANDAAGLDLSTTSNAVYATGEFERTTNFGALTTNQNPNDRDLFMIKYNLNGDEQWLTEAGSADRDFAASLVADESDVYFTGYFEGASLNIRDKTGTSAGSLNNTNPGIEDILLVSFDSNGNYNWSEKISSTGGERGHGITMDQDSLYITGSLSENSNFPGYSGNPLSTPAIKDIFVSSHAKSNGNTGWVRVVTSSDAGAQHGRCIDTDENGNLLVSGDFEAESFFPDGVTLSAEGGHDVFVASYSANGIFQWVKQAGSSGAEDAHAVAAGSNGVIYAGGKYSDLFTAGSLSLPNNGSSNGFLAQLKQVPLPSNDTPCDADLLAVGDSCNASVYNNTGATDSGIPDPGCGNYQGADVWFKAVIPPSGNLFIGTNVPEDDTYPPVNGWMYRVNMAIYSGTCGSLNLEGCYADNSSYQFRASSVFLYDNTPGDTVWIRVWEYQGNDNGLFSICSYDPGHNPAWDIPDILCENGNLIDLDTTLSEGRSGFADQVIGSQLTFEFGSALGAPDGSYVGLYTEGDWITLDLSDTIPAGEAIHLYFRSYLLSPDVTRMTLSTSVDDSNYFPHSFKPETELDGITRHTIIAERPTRYLRIENINAGGGGFALDAIGYDFRGTRGGTWSGPGVTGSLFDPFGLSGPVPITYSAGGSSNRTDSTIITLISNLEAGILSGDTTVCSEGNEINLFLSGSEGDLLNWESSEDGFLTITSTGVAESSFIISNLTQSTDFRVIAQNGTCPPDTSNIVTVNVFEQPLADPGPGGETCGNTYGLQAIPSIGVGQWSKEAGPGNVTFSPGPDNPIVGIEVDQFGTYEFSWTETNGLCSDDSTVTVTFFENPVINPGMGGDTCGFVFGLQAVPSLYAKGKWTMESGPGFVSFTPSDTLPDAIATVTKYGAFEFTWTEINGPCTAGASITVNFYDSPIADPGTGGETCGNTYGLQATPSVGVGQWSKSSGPGNVIFTPGPDDPNVSVEVDQFGDYEFTWTEHNGSCSDDSSLTVSFYELPAINPGLGGDTCGLSFALQAVPSVGKGYWIKNTGPGTATFSPSDTIPDPVVTVTQYGSYTFNWYENNGSCSTGGSIVVDFYTAPNVDPGTGGEVCGLEFGLNAMPSFGSGIWSKKTGPGSASFDPSDDAADTRVTVTEYGDYEFTWTESNGDCGNDSTILVTFFEHPESYAGPDAEICSSDKSFMLTGSSISNGTITWTSNGDGSFDLSTLDNPTYTLGSETESVILYKTVHGEGLCGDAVDSMILTIVPTPVSNAGMGGQKCGLEFGLSAVPDIGLGTWSKVSGVGTVTFSPSPADPDAIVTVSQAGLYEFSWTEVNGTCTDAESVMVDFIEYLTVDAGNGGAICGPEIILTASPATGSGHWSVVSGPGEVNFTPSDSINVVNVMVDEFGEYVFQWEEVLEDCQGTDTVVVNFHAQPQVDAGPDQVLEFEFSTYMNASMIGFGIGKWEIVSGEGQLDDASDPLTLVTDLGLGDNIFKWTILSDVCDDVSDNVTITVNDLQTPTVITPNRDGQNDFLTIPGVDQIPGCELIIFNRWGNEVYHSENYQNDWEGLDHKGRELLPDTYYYVLTIPPERVVKSFIEIRR